MGLQTPAETPPPPCQPQTDRRRAGRPFVWLFSLKEADFQGDAHRVCLCPRPAHPVADRQVGGGCLDSTQRDGPQSLPLRGWVWASPTTHGNLMPLGYRAGRRQTLPESSEHREMSNQKPNHCRLPLSPGSPQVTKWQNSQVIRLFVPHVLPGKQGAQGPRCTGTEGTHSSGAVWASRRSAKDMWAPVTAPPPSADGTRAPWEMSRLPRSLGPAWQPPVSSLTGGGCGGGSTACSHRGQGAFALRTAYGARLVA